MTEKEVEKSIIIYIRKIGGRCQKVHSGKAMMTNGQKNYCIQLADKGTPDILACIKGKFVGIEVKKDGKEIKKRLKQKDKRSLGQKKQAESIQIAGGYFCLVSSIGELQNDLLYLGLI